MAALVELKAAAPDETCGSNQDQHADEIGVAEDEKHYAISPFGKGILSTDKRDSGM